jgi:hypothetical protein
MTVASPFAVSAKFIRVGPVVHFYLGVSFTLGGTASQTVLVTPPVAAAVGSGIVPLSANGTPFSSGLQLLLANIDSSGIIVRLNPVAAWTLGVTSFNVSGTYPV